MDDVVGAMHSRSCNIFNGGHGKDGSWRPAPCDCGAES
jgi:hypothetical protein